MATTSAGSASHWPWRLARGAASNRRHQVVGCRLVVVVAVRQRLTYKSPAFIGSPICQPAKLLQGPTATGRFVSLRVSVRANAFSAGRHLIAPTWPPLGRRTPAKRVHSRPFQGARARRITNCDPSPRAAPFASPVGVVAPLAFAAEIEIEKVHIERHSSACSSQRANSAGDTGTC